MPDDIRQRSALRALRRRAYEELNLAIDQSGDELPSDWLKEGDHDLQALREMNEAEWRLLVRRQTGAEAPKDPQFPASAWGDPHRRRNEWLAIALALVVLAVIVVVAAVPDEVWVGLGVVAVLVGLALIWTLARHRGWILGGIVLVGAAIYGLSRAPESVPVTLAILVAAAGAFFLSERARTAAEAADTRSIALWDHQAKENGSQQTERSATLPEPEQPKGRPTDPPKLT